MLLRKIKSHEFRECLELSKITSEPYPEFPVHDKTSLTNMRDLARNHYLRVIEKDGKIVGWLCAVVVLANHYSNIWCLRQITYSTSLKGREALLAFNMVHESMIEFARKRKVPYVVSGSIEANWRTFGRLLERQGWTVRYREAVFCVSERAETRPPGTLPMPGAEGLLSQRISKRNNVTIPVGEQT
jgi:hypothetical protein